MKKESVLLMLTLTAVFFARPLYCAAQQPSVPTAVSTNLTVLFPQAKSVEWRSYPDVIQAVFSVGGMKCEAKFKPDGGWVMTERQLPVDSLPQTVRTALQSSPYADWSIDKSFVLSTANNNRYRVVVVNKDMLKKIVSFDSQGQLVKEKLSL